MHWWQGAFSSSRSNSDDEGASSDVPQALKASFFFSRRTRHLLRAKKAAAADNELWRASSRKEKTSSGAPQPLPLPELQELLRKDDKFTPPLPSRRDSVEDWVNAEAADDAFHCSRRLAGQETKGDGEHPETQSSRKSPRKGSAKPKSSENISIDSSAPTSPYSSITLSPPVDIFTTRYKTPPGIFQVWSAPEIPHSDRNLGLGFHNQWPSDRSAASVDNSPLQSPRLSTHIHSNSPSMPTSPLSTKIPPDSPFGRWENNAQANVHPLPLPPGPQPVPTSSGSDYQGCSMQTQSPPGPLHSARPEFGGANVASQPAPLSPVASKPERTPIKSKWQKGKLIGRGTFGSVYVASNRETGALCAMKEVEILPDDSKSAECIRQLQQEIKVLSRLKHPNIVRYYGSEIVGDKFYIYLEYVHPGSINKFILDHCGAITESVVRNFTRHILCGLAYLHKKKTIHRDIKGANLLVDAYGVVKLADFGTAKHLTGQAADLSLKGSPYWLAPELLQSAMQKDSSSEVALAVDIWSLGCTIIEMMNGRPPWSEYEGAAAMFKVLQEIPPIPETLSADGKDFLLKCFRRNPAERPSASMLLEHPFLNYSQQSEASTQSLPEMKLMENTHLREHPDYRKGKPGESKAIQQKNQQITIPFSHSSPRSTLEALPTLSPHDSGHNPESPCIKARHR